MTSQFSKNLAAKLISVLFALLLWIYVMSVINPRITKEELNIGVQITNESVLRQSGLVVLGRPDASIRVRLTGNRDQVHRIERERIDARADLRGFEEGVNSVPIEVTVPGNVEVEFTPKYVTVELERIITRQKEVTLETEGELAPGHVLGETRIRPGIVWLEGPESYVNAVEQLVASLGIEGRSDNLSVSLPLRALNSRGEEVEGVTVKSPSVDVSIVVDLRKTVAIRLDLDINPAEGHRIVEIRSNPTSVTILGQPNVMAGLHQIETEKLERDEVDESFRETVPLVFSEGVKPADQGEVEVEVRVEALIDKEFSIPRENHRFENLNPALQIREEDKPEKLTITMTGLESIINAISPGIVLLDIDLEGLEEGEHTVTPRARLLMGLENALRDISTEPEPFQLRLTPLETDETDEDE